MITIARWRLILVVVLSLVIGFFLGHPGHVICDGGVCG